MQRSSNPRFATTRWSLVAQAADQASQSASQALGELCEAYWTPLYAFARRRGLSAEDAQDKTQSFFVMLLEGDLLDRADQSRGRFRTFLLTLFQRFLSNQLRTAKTQKRGGNRRHLSFSFADAERDYQLEPADRLTPELLFERRWALTLLDRVLQQLRAKYEAKGRLAQFETLQNFLSGAQAADQQLRSAADSLGMSPGALRVATHRLREQYRQMLRAEVAQTLAHDADVDTEIGQLMAALQK